MKFNKEKFDAVKFMRTNLEELSRLDSENPSGHKMKMDAIRKKYQEKFVKKKRNEA